MKSYYFFVLLVSLLFVFGCKKEDNNVIIPVDENKPKVVTDVLSDINKTTVWYSDTLYVIKTFDFFVNAALTIQEGTIIKFHPELGPYMVIGSNGKIIANGTEENPIIFTSYFDDTSGGDTNMDDALIIPARKDWGYINTNAQHDSEFSFCTFMYGGDGLYSSTLYVNSLSNTSVTNCTFAHNDGSDGSGQYGVLDASTSGHKTVIENNIFFDNIRPLSINTNSNVTNSNLFHNPENPSVTNWYNGIFVTNINNVTEEIRWDETEVAFVINSNLRVFQNAALVLGDYVVLKFQNSGGLSLSEGVSALGNRGGQGVAFTSYKDDNLKGNTNGDESFTLPENNSWVGIFDHSLSEYATWENVYYDSY